jgi:catechol 2,3-dioxygenase-like lactoylglutathione lyase family enzyme
MSNAGLQAESFATNITASDLQRSIKFYTEGFGFEIVQRHEPEGTLRYVAMKAGNAHIGLGTDDFAKGRDRVKGIGLRISITTTQDIAALADRAKKAGITLDDGPAPLPWGPMGFSVTDPDGFKLTIANPMA